jgi:hypothetical protein
MSQIGIPASTLPEESSVDYVLGLAERTDEISDLVKVPYADLRAAIGADLTEEITTAQEATDADRRAVESIRADFDVDAPAKLAELNTAGAAQVTAVNNAGVAQRNLIAGAVPRNIYASTADALSNGVLGHASLVAGSGGTNGTFDVAITGGGGTGAAARFTVTGGQLVGILWQSKGRNYTSAPTLSFAASAGLTGASAIAVIGQNEPPGSIFGVAPGANAALYDVFENVAGVATPRGSSPSEARLAAVSALASPVVKAGLLLDSDGAVGQMAFDTVNNKFYMPKPATGKWSQPFAMTRDAMPPSGVVGLWFAKDISNGIMPNRLAPANATDPTKVLTRCPRECFVTGAVGDFHWLNTNLTPTANFAADLDGTMSAMRLVSTSPGAGEIRRRTTFTRPAGTYTLVANLQANGGAQNLEWTRNGGSTWNAFTQNTAMVQNKFEFTLGSTATLDLRIRPASGVTMDVNAGNIYLWDGSASSVPADLVFGGHGYIGDVPSPTVNMVGNALRLADGQCIHFDLPARYVGASGTLLAVTRRLNATSNVGFEERMLFDVLTNSSANSVGIKEASLGSGAFQLQGAFQKSISVPIGGFSPNLFLPRNDINSIVLAAGADGIEFWLGDCLIQQEISSPAPTTRTIQHWQYGSNQPWPRNHELLALAYAPVKLTADERRQLLKHIEDELARDSKTLFRPRNHIHCDLDSITVGPSNNGWAQQMLADLSQPAYVLQNAIGGSTLALNPTFQLNMSNRLPAVLNGMPQTAETRAGRRFLSVILPGANDIQPNYASEAAFLTALEAQTAQLKAKGRIVIIIQPLHKGSGAVGFATHNTRVDNIRTTLAGWVAAGKADAVVVVSGNANIGTFASTSNLTFWNADGVHLTAAGQTELKNLVAPVVNSFLLPV